MKHRPVPPLDTAKREAGFESTPFDCTGKGNSLLDARGTDQAHR